MTLNVRKLAQIVNYLLSKYAYRLNYTKLIKELYIYDKKAIELWDTPVTTDSAVSMPNGPVLSALYDLIKNGCGDTDTQHTWNAFFYTEGYDLISLVEGKLPTGELSRREIKLLDEIDEEFHDRHYGWFINYTHRQDIFPEYEDSEGSSLPIPFERILKSVGRSDVEVEEITGELDAVEKEEQYLKTCCE
jgi:hypothetical protein